MKIIDAFTGRDDLGVGSVVPTVSEAFGPHYKILSVRDGFFRAWVLIEYPGVSREPEWVQLAVRFTHPKYLFQRVAFS